MVKVSSNDRYEDTQGMSLQAVDQYARQVRWIQTEPLHPDEETRLLQRLERSRCNPSHQHYALLAKDARDRLIEAYQPVIWSIAQQIIRPFRGNSSMDVLDLVSEGNIGFLRLFERATFGAYQSFRSFFALVVRGAMITALRQHGAEISLHSLYIGGERASSYLKRFRVARASLMQQLHREPSYEELAQELGMSVSQVCEVIEISQIANPLSLQGLFSSYDHEDDYVELVNVFEPEEVSFCEKRAQQVHHALDTVLACREREALWYRYGFDAEESGLRTWEEVRQIMGIKNATSLGAYHTNAKNKLVVALASVVA